MVRFPVSAEKEQQLLERMEELGIREDDIVEKFIRGSGAGGQKINKTSSCVYLHHRPTGIEVKCQRERSQALNRYLARRQLCNRLEAQEKGKKSAKQQELERVRRQKRRRSRRSKQKMLEGKRKRSETKISRLTVDDDS